MTISPVYISVVGSCALVGAYAIGKKIKDKVIPFVSDKVSSCFMGCKRCFKNPNFIDATETQELLRGRIKELKKDEESVLTHISSLQAEIEKAKRFVTEIKKQTRDCEELILGSEIDRQRKLADIPLKSKGSTSPRGGDLHRRLATPASKPATSKKVEALSPEDKETVQTVLVREVKKIKYKNQSNGALSEHWNVPDFRETCLGNLLEQLQKRGLSFEQLRDAVLTLKSKEVTPADFRGVI